MTTAATVAIAFFSKGGACWLRHSDGTEESFADLQKRAVAKLPESVRGSMDRSMVSQNANYNIQFDNSYFPTNRQGSSSDENNQMRQVAVAKRFAVLGAVVSELAEAGFVAGEHYTVKDTYRDGDQWKPTTQLWLNVNRPGQAASAVISDEDLMVNALIADSEKAENIIGDATEELSTIQRARLKAIIAKANAGQTADSEAPAAEDKDEMPTD